MGRLRIDPADVIAIAAGGVVGALVRERLLNPPIEGDWFAYAPNTSVIRYYDPPLDTRLLVINAAGCLLLGALTVVLVRTQGRRSRRALVGLSTGFCGSLTTFSAFAVHVAQLLRGDVFVGGPDQIDVPNGLGYLALSVVAGALAFALGRIVARLVTDR